MTTKVIPRQDQTRYWRVSCEDGRTRLWLVHIEDGKEFLMMDMDDRAMKAVIAMQSLFSDQFAHQIEFSESEENGDVETSG